MSKKILISGGGLAGLTTAYWLHKRGFTPIVIEQASSLRRGGYGIDFFGSGYDVAERMGIIDKLTARELKVKHISFLEESGKEISHLSFEVIRDKLDGRYIGLMHYVLEEELEAVIKDNIEIRYNTSIKTLRQSADAVTVTFEDDTQETFDYLIGADGIHSNVRNLVFGPEVQFARFMGYYVASYLIPNTFNMGPRWENYNEVGYNSALYLTDQEDTLAAFFLWKSEYVGRIPASERLPTLKKVTASLGWRVPAMLANAPDGRDIFIDDVTQIVMSRWSKGRIVLVGDSCGCMTLMSGQGASMALAGGYILAEEMSLTEDMQAAFINYENRFRPHIEYRQKRARSLVKSFVPANERAKKITKFMTKLLIRDAFAGIIQRAAYMGDSVIREQMCHRLPQSEGNILGYHIAGKLESTDYQMMSLDINHALETAPDVRILLQIDDLAGLDLSAIKADLQFSRDYRQNIAKLAVVGNRRLTKWIAGTSQPFFAQTVQHFSNHQLNESWHWLVA